MTFFLCAVFGGPASVRAASGSLVPVPDPSAKAAILIDDTTGQVLWSKNPQEHMAPASTTKILTALIAIEKGNLNEVVTIPKDAVGVEGSSIGLQQGETFTLKNLLYALLLESANDSAVAIADTIAGSVPAFVHMMNEKAVQLGAVNSHFANPDGLFDPDHYVTAADMAIIARAAMQNPVFREIVDTRTYTLPPRPNPESQVDLVNQNRLLGLYPGCIGVKPGYVILSGETLVSAADRNGRELLAVELDSTPASMYTDAASMLNYGFGDFTSEKIAGPDQVVSNMPVRYGTSSVDLVPTQPVYYDFPLNSSPDVDKRVEISHPLIAPIQEGQQLGTLVLSWQGRDIGQVPLVARSAVNRMLYADWFFWLIVILVAGGSAYILALRAWSGNRRYYRSRYRVRRR